MMNHRVIELALLSCLACASISAGAQGLRLPALPSAPVAGAAPAAVSQRPADYIVAIVNSEPITNNQVRQEMQRMARQLTQARRPVPDAREMAAQVLDLLINERAQLQLAREYGLKIDDAAIDDAERTVARQNRVEVEELYRRLAADGIARNQFRNQLRDQLLLLRVREREVNQKVRISDLEVDQYLRDQQKNPDPASTEMSLAHVLVGVPEDASATQIAAAQEKAQKLLDSARSGADFAALAREFSDAADARSGGLTSLRRADRYPTLFVEATQNMAAGEMTLVRSDAGFHVLKLVEKRGGGMPAASVVQTRASHILLLPSAQMGEAAMLEKLNGLRRRIVEGQADFATLARENSQDGSAPQGGDLGWAGPGQFVPEFEEAMNALAPGQVSAPLISRFGAHLIRVTERRTVPLSQREQREAVRALMRDKKLDEAFNAWTQALRGRAYVEMREPPG